MSIPHTNARQIVDVLPLGAALTATKTTILVKTSDLEIIRLVIRAGKEIPTHKAPGEIAVQCLEGRAAFTAGCNTQELAAGQLLYLATAEPHSVKGLDDSSLLVTIVLPKKKLDLVQEASEESFPASDSPAITATHS